jgi:hypothetical protein
MTIMPAPDVAPQPSRRTVARSILTVLLFGASVVLGATIQLGAMQPGRHIERFPTISDGAAEPQVTAEIADAITSGKPQVLASKYSADMLQSYQQAMSPVVVVDDIRYVGGVVKDGETLASYVATGQTNQGVSMISGFVVHVKGGEITGFN